jgi:hypothetical protein
LYRRRDEAEQFVDHDDDVRGQHRRVRLNVLLLQHGQFGGSGIGAVQHIFAYGAHAMSVAASSRQGRV